MRLWLFYLKYRWAFGLFYIVICFFVSPFSQCFVVSCFAFFYKRGEIDALSLAAIVSILVKGKNATPMVTLFLLFQMFLALYPQRTFELAFSKDLQTSRLRISLVWLCPVLFQMSLALYPLRTFEHAFSEDLQTPRFQMAITLYLLMTFEPALFQYVQPPRLYIAWGYQLYTWLILKQIYSDSNSKVDDGSVSLGSRDDNSSMEFELTESQMDPFETVIPIENRFLFYNYNIFFNNEENQKLINFIKELPVGTDENVLLQKVRACAFDLIETGDLKRIERFEAQYPK